MKKYFKFLLMMMAGLFVSRIANGWNSSRRSVRPGSMSDHGFGYGEIFVTVIFLIGIGLLVCFIV